MKQLPNYSRLWQWEAYCRRTWGKFYLSEFEGKVNCTTYLPIVGKVVAVYEHGYCTYRDNQYIEVGAEPVHE